MEKIKSAAIRDQRGDIFSLPPPAHHKQIIASMKEQGKTTKLMVKGFLTSDDRFVGRLQGARIALKSGQATKLRFAPDLHSGDMWEFPEKQR